MKSFFYIYVYTGNLSTYIYNYEFYNFVFFIIIACLHTIFK